MKKKSSGKLKHQRKEILTLQGTSSIVTTLTVDRSLASSSVIVLDNIKANLPFQENNYINLTRKTRL
jgi:hypothetical protein